MATFVLVHGSWHGGWCWTWVARRLRAAGHEVHTPTLTGLGCRSHQCTEGIDLTTHVTDIANYVEFEDLRDVVLVGHSYSGMVISGVTGRIPSRLRLVVYLDAYVAEAGESMLDQWPAERRQRTLDELARGNWLRPPPTADYLGIHDLAMATWVTARLVPHPLGTYREPLAPGCSLDGAPARAFIHCQQGDISPRFRAFADRLSGHGWPVYTLDAGHDAMVVAPDALADVLARAAELAGTNPVGEAAAAGGAPA